MDYMSIFPSNKHGHNCVIVVVDRSSKMAILAPCKKSITTKATTRLFFEHVWVNFGIPQTIISDRDTKFFSTFWYNLWSLMDTMLTKSTSFHPQTYEKMKVVNMMIVHVLHIYTPSIHIHGMRAFHMFIIAIIDPSKTLLAITLFRCAWGSNHWPPLM
jgi:hypothetical protein